jgi:acyl-CoA thioester hydrolase
MGIVYHTNYIKWFEIGRTELLRSVGIVYAEMEAQGYNLPLTEVYCNYLFPAKYEKAMVEGYTIHACINKMGKIVRIPSFILEKVEEQMQIKF